MNKEVTRNQVNDLIDQRLSQSESKSALDTCVNDESAVKAWRDYHLIGDVIRGEIGATGNCLISKVSEALDQEPTILAPVRKLGTSTMSSGTQLADLESGNGDRKNDTIKSAGMFAIAASVALFAVLAFSPAPIETTNNLVAAVAVPQDTDSAESFEAEFGQMLVEHGEFTGTAGLNGLVAYAKLVSNESLGQ